MEKLWQLEDLRLFYEIADLEHLFLRHEIHLSKSSDRPPRLQLRFESCEFYQLEFQTPPRLYLPILFNETRTGLFPLKIHARSTLCSPFADNEKENSFENQ